MLIFFFGKKNVKQNVKLCIILLDIYSLYIAMCINKIDEVNLTCEIYNVDTRSLVYTLYPNHFHTQNIPNLIN